MNSDEEATARRLLALPEAGWPRQYGCTHVRRLPLPGTSHRYPVIYRWERCTECYLSLRRVTREFGVQREQT